MNEENCQDPDCAKAVELLHAYIDGELAPDDLGQIKGHLERCSPCEGAFEFEESLRAVISAKCAEKAPAELRERLVAMVSDHVNPTQGDTGGE